VVRAMRRKFDGTPELGASMRTLGVRVRDLHPRLDGTVDPGHGGLSVSPDPESLPRATRPEGLGGIGKDPIFGLETEYLPDESLSYRLDPRSPETHGFIEPAYPMKFEHYQRLIHKTSAHWHPM
jgi:hypothetical protein